MTNFFAFLTNFYYICCRVRQMVLTDVAFGNSVAQMPLGGIKAHQCYLGRSYVPHCSFRSKAKVNCFLHALRKTTFTGSFSGGGQARGVVRHQERIKQQIKCHEA